MTASLTEQLIDNLGGYDALSEPAAEGAYRTIRADKVEAIADEVISLIADLVGTLIDAGSEREVVMENDALYTAIRDELKGWSA